MILPDDSAELDGADEDASDSGEPRLSRSEQTRAATAVHQLGVRLVTCSGASDGKISNSKNEVLSPQKSEGVKDY